MAAIDLDHLSGGRFILGLGTSVSVVRRHLRMPSTGRSRALREAVALIRLVVAGLRRATSNASRVSSTADFSPDAAHHAAAPERGDSILARREPAAHHPPRGRGRRRRDVPPDLVVRSGPPAMARPRLPPVCARRPQQERCARHDGPLRRDRQRAAAGGGGRPRDRVAFYAGVEAYEAPSSPPTASPRKARRCQSGSPAATTSGQRRRCRRDGGAIRPLWPEPTESPERFRPLWDLGDSSGSLLRFSGSARAPRGAGPAGSRTPSTAEGGVVVWPPVRWPLAASVATRTLRKSGPRGLAGRRRHSVSASSPHHEGGHREPAPDAPRPADRRRRRRGRVRAARWQPLRRPAR